MRISDVSIDRPVLTGMVALAVMVVGGLAYFRLGLGLFPNVSFPVVGIVVPYPGASPEEVESQVTRPIEEIVYGINGVDKVQSYSRESVSQVVVLFEMSVDPQQASNDVRDRMAMIRGDLPREVQDPMISRFDPNAKSVLTYTVTSQQGSVATRQLVADVIRPAIEQVDGVGNVAITGGDEREIRVEADRHKLSAVGISLSQVAQAIGAESIDVPGGRVTVGTREIGLKASGRIQSPGDVGEIVLASFPTGARVRVKDVATVVDGVKEARTLTRIDGVPSITLEVHKQATANTVEVADEVGRVIEDLGDRLPSDVRISSVIDNSQFTRRNFEELREALVLGAISAILVIFLFMLDWRSTLISAIALPTSVVASFFVMWQLGFTLNMITMLALSLSIGLLIDDSVVVRENIFRHMERGEDPVTAARRGTSEIAAAVMATTFTIVAVFAPIAFTGGVAGRMLREFGLTVAAAVLVSLVVSLTLDPMLSSRIVQRIPAGYHEIRRRHRVFGPLVRAYDALDGAYRRVLVWALGHGKTVAAVAIALFAVSLLLTRFMGTEFVDPGDQGAFLVNVELPAGTSLGETDRITGQVEAIVRQEPGVVTVATTVGPGEEVNKAAIRVQAVPRRERSRSTRDMLESLRSRLGEVDGLVYSLRVVDPMGLDSNQFMEAPITLRVRGPDYAELARIAGEAFDLVRETPGVRDASLSFQPGMREKELIVDRERAGEMGVTFALAAMTLRTGLTGEPVAKFRDGQHDIDVRVQLRPEDRSSVDSVLELGVPSNRGGLVLLRDLVDVAESAMPATIERTDRERHITISANLAGRPIGDVLGDLQPKLDGIARGPGYGFHFAGEAELMKETFTNLGLALILGLVFIYFVLAAQFESLVHPFTIMLSLPLAVIGALLFLFVLGINLCATALLGGILLMGLVTKNAILLVDYTNQLRDGGKGMTEALLLAGPTRLRPILMTSAAMILGMLPSAIGTGEGREFRMPMAIAVIGGVLASTFLTLVVVPVVYVWLDRFTIRSRAIGSRG